jgi:hypothetical protein
VAKFGRVYSGIEDVMTTRALFGRQVAGILIGLGLAASGGVLVMPAVAAQELGGAGTVQGTVKDPTGAVMVAATVTISNPVSGFKRQITTDAAGRFVFRNLPPNAYHVEISAQGFQTLEQDIEVRTSVPIELSLALAVAGATTTVEVSGHATDLLERDPTAHTDVDQALIARLPVEPSAGLNQIITMASPGVVADANGFFHPIGDHAQTQFSIDNQPVTDQQSRIYSNQISPDAVQSMELITGVAPAEFGDKTSLIVRVVTKSGLDQSTPTGSFTASYGSFKTPSVDLNAGAGNHTIGNFASFSGLRTDRFLDPPEFEALHDEGNSQSFFDRLDVHPNDVDTFHLNVHTARSSFNVPNTFDQDALGQDQRQKITSFNVAPGYTRILGENLLLTANGYVRRDHVNYTPSADPFADTPGSVSQDRTLTNYGAKVDLAYAKGIHNVKFGGTVSATKLSESFSLGLTDPSIAEEFPGLAPFDLTQGGTPFTFNGEKTIKEQALYAQDEIKAGDATFKLGLRMDHYDGFTTKTLFQPRVGVSYAVPKSGTILRASYGRTMETPYNENLILSSSADPAIFGTSGVPLPAGTRDQVEAGVQQAFGKWIVADVGYFYKHTTNGYDFGALFDTPIFFPVSWDHSKLNGLTARINLIEHKGFSAFTVMGHTSAIYYPPGTGGILLEQPDGAFRIDHDQKFQQTTNVQYVFEKTRGAWVAFAWRYDSGLVAGSVPDYATALGLTADQQAAIGLFCGGTVASLGAPITACAAANRGATRINIPADGTEDDLNNPARIAPRHLFDLGLGVDNLLRTEKSKVKVRFSVINLTDKDALYNFLSTFSGTHFVTPRTYQLTAGITF